MCSECEFWRFCGGQCDAMRCSGCDVFINIASCLRSARAFRCWLVANEKRFTKLQNGRQRIDDDDDDVGAALAVRLRCHSHCGHLAYIHQGRVQPSRKSDHCDVATKRRWQMKMRRRKIRMIRTLRCRRHITHLRSSAIIEGEIPATNKRKKYRTAVRIWLKMCLRYGMWILVIPMRRRASRRVRLLCC